MEKQGNENDYRVLKKKLAELKARKAAQIENTVKRCMVYGCGSVHDPKKMIKLHSMPNKLSRSEIFSKWKEVLNIDGEDEDVQAVKVCNKHFNLQDYYIKKVATVDGVEKKQKFLREEAFPSQFLPESLVHKIQYESNADLEHRLLLEAKIKPINNIPAYVCGVPGCESIETEHNLFFKIPNAKDIQKIWLQKLQLSNPHIRICGRHFEESDYISLDIRKGIGPNTVKYLKHSAVPSHNLPIEEIYIKAESFDLEVEPEIDSLLMMQHEDVKSEPESEPEPVTEERSKSPPPPEPERDEFDLRKIRNILHTFANPSYNFKMIENSENGELVISYTPLLQLRKLVEKKGKKIEIAIPPPSIQIDQSMEIEEEYLEEYLEPTFQKALETEQSRSNNNISDEEKGEPEEKEDVQIQCKFCPYKFSSQIDLKTHMEKPNIHNKLYLCMFCDEEFSDYQLYLEHKKEHDNETLDCPHCEQKFRLSANLEQHKKKAHREKTKSHKIICDVCGAEVHNFFYKRHLIKEHGQNFDSEYVNCKTCGKKLSKKQLSRHMRDHTNKENKRRKCRLCNAVFETPENLKSHVKETHVSQSYYSCIICLLGFDEPEALEGHVKNDHTIQDFNVIKDWKRLYYTQCIDKKVFSYECKVCGKESHSNKNILHHIMKSHIKNI